VEKLSERRDPLAAAKDDTDFVAEVKRLARQCGLSESDLARKLEKRPSTIFRHLQTSGRPHLATVERYAKALNVPLAHLRIVAGHWNEEDDNANAIVSLRRLFEESYFRENGATELWSRLLKSPQSVIVVVVTRAYRAQLQDAANLACGLTTKRDASATLREILHDVGIDVTEYLSRVPTSVLSDVDLHLTGIEGVTDDDRRFLVDALEQRIRQRGQDTDPLARDLALFRGDLFAHFQQHKSRHKESS